MFEKILIANRGEIACRIMATCRRLGIATVAVYSDVDSNARHVRMADQAVCIGSAAAADSYLRGDRMVETALREAAQAIHPGYGFLSEAPQFAELCERAGVVFIGPSAAAMRAMSSKASAKQLMQRAGVPLLPGYHGEQQDAASLRREAERLGFPLLIKAAAGGGGKGLRLVEQAGEFEDRLAACQREAQQAFGDARLLLEKYLERPRHIEVQIFGDTHGHVMHLFERDCSAQRRHQKVLEEAPALGISANLRSQLTRVACEAAAAAGYSGAGTVEFLLDRDGHFYFLEMNTRLQVEHPVTEMLVGCDLVEWQLRVAAGEPLPLTPPLRANGHAIEVRLYAEVPETGFLPSTGTLTRFQLPLATPQLRLESGVDSGDSVGIHYDPMLAKLIVHATTRPLAIALLRQALTQVRIRGLGNNLQFLRRLVAHPGFMLGAIDTGFIERELPALTALAAPVPPPVLVAAALFTVAQEQAEGRASTSIWGQRDGWRLNGWLTRTLQFRPVAGAPLAVVLEYRPQGMLARTDNGGGLASLLALGNDEFTLHYRDRAQSLQIEADGTQLRLLLEADEYRLLRGASLQQAAPASPGEAKLVAPMPGRIVALLATAGSAVPRGTPLLVLEAMKMEHTICAPAHGVLQRFRVGVGEQVTEGAELLEFEATA